MPFVQSKNNLSAASSTTITVTFTSSVTAGNLIAVYAYCDWNENISGASDNLGNTYTAADANTGLSGKRISTFYAKNIAGGSCTVTITFTASINQRGVIVHEISGCDTTAPLGQHAIASQDTSTATDALTSGNVTTTTDGEYIFGATSGHDLVDGWQAAAGTNYTLREQVAGTTSTFPQSSEDRVQTTAGSIAATFTQNNANRMSTAIMTFKAAAGVSNLSINVNDSVTVAESVTMQLLPILLSVNDAVTVAESITMNVILMPNVNEAVTVSESVTMNVILMPSVSDDVTVAEAVVMNVILMPNVNDAVTVAESVTVSITSIGLIPINVFDAVTVSEAVTVSIPYLPISVSDDVTVVESISVVEIGGTKRRNLLTMKAGF